MKDSSPIALGTVYERTEVFRADSASRQIFDHITGRWASLIFAALSSGPLRFFQLRDAVGGITEKMLSQTLRMLERNGLVTRTVQPTKPPQVIYALTELGAQAAGQLCGLITWIDASATTIIAAQERYDTPE